LDSHHFSHNLPERIEQIKLPVLKILLVSSF
jgi:hypothetical protein